MVPDDRVDDVVRVPHVMVLTIERANAAPSVAGGAKADAAETMDSIGGVRDGDGGVLDAEAPRCREFAVKIRDTFAQLLKDDKISCSLNC